MNTKQNYINHISVVVDASASMGHLERDVVKVVDNLVAYLATRSGPKEFDQETRVTVYVFNHEVTCAIYDKDVLRLHSIEKFYFPRGRTALIDATMQSIEDSRLIPQKYGDHAFLTYVLTDGQENDSRKWLPHHLTNMLTLSLHDNETVAILVPDQTAKFDAKSFGFPTDNIAIWDATSARGLAEAGEIIRKSADSFMTGRMSGVRSTRTLFSTGIDAVNKETIKSAQLKPLATRLYKIVKVDEAAPIREWMDRKHYSFVRGNAYYELTKPENIQPYKQIIIQHITSGRVYSGPQARDLLGLPDMHVRVTPDYNPEYRIYVQSTSVNRKLVPDTNLLIMK